MFYTAEETASSMRFIAQVDLALIQDGTYFVLEAGEEVVACGGWSRRDKLYTGSGDAAEYGTLDARAPHCLGDQVLESPHLRAE